MIQTPDVRLAVMEHLKTRVACPVVAIRPDDDTPQYVHVIDTGGAGRKNRVIQNVQVTIDCYGRSLAATADLARQVDAAMYALPASNKPISAVQGSNPVESTAQTNAVRRYSATYQLKTLCK